MTWLNPYDLWMWQNAKGGGATVVNTIVRSSHVVAGDALSAIFDHPFLTTSVVPCFTPSWNTQVYPTQITDRQIAVNFSIASPPGATMDLAVSRGTRAAVSTGAESYTITHNAGSVDTVVLVACDWNTQIYRSTKTANTILVKFSVAAPAGKYIYWSQHAETLDVYDTDSVTAGQSTWTISHNNGHAYSPVFLLPSWATITKFVTKGQNETTVSFSAEAPSGAELDWRVKRT